MTRRSVGSLKSLRVTLDSTRSFWQVLKYHSTTPSSERNIIIIIILLLPLMTIIIIGIIIYNFLKV